MPHAKRKALKAPPRYFRAPRAKGGEPRVDYDGGHRGRGVIRGVSVVTRGEAVGHGMWLDHSFTASVAEHINATPQGIKARFTHPSLSGDGLGSFLGRVRDASAKGDQVVADLHFSETAHRAPDGDLAQYVMELATEDPEAFGLSIVFEPDVASENAFHLDNRDENGDFHSPDPDNTSHLPHARLASLRAADVVDDPAANPNGLFHREQDFAQEASAIASYALGLTTERPALVSLGLDADRVADFFQRFLNENGLEIKNMATDQAQPATEPQVTEPREHLTEQQSAYDGKRFVEAFGEKGALWFVEGKSFEECQQLQAQQQNNRLAEQDAKIADLEKRLTAATKAAGETTPVDFQSGEKKEQTRKGFASRIRLPEPSAN